MALFLKQDDERSELQKQVAAELQRRAKENSKNENDFPDGVNDSQYIKGTKQTTSLAWLWLLILIIAAGIIIWLTVSTGTL